MTKKVYSPSPAPTADWELSKVVHGNHLSSYENTHRDIRERMVQIHNSIIILETMQQFPFQYFVAAGKMDFWKVLYWNFIHIVVVMMHGLLWDTGKDACTLPKLKNNLFKSWVTDQYKEKFYALLREAKFDEESQDIGKRITEMRHKLIAHRLMDEDSQLPIENVEGVTVSDLRKVYQSLECLFNVCSFESHFETRLLDFIAETTVGGIPQQSHLQHIFELIVRDSCLFNEPDQLYWESVKELRPREEAEILIEWRKRLGVSQTGETLGKGTYKCRRCRNNATEVTLNKTDEKLPKCPNCDGTQFDRMSG